ncbi:MAG: reactive intermediate/imine deaminase [Bryobacteraceae bacterium]|nr:reactive intermediate/imine deaminase [Bryobacteraceae bacterium]
MLIPVPVAVPLLPPNNETYSQAVRLGDLIFVSGQLGVDPATGLLVPGGIPEQTRQALDNIAAILLCAGSALDQVAKVTIFLTDFALLSAMNEVYGPRLPHRPAKTTVEITRLDKNALIEIEVVAGAG